MDNASMFSIDHWNDFLKIISLIGFFLILVTLTMILLVGPVSSYEFSIYDAYPWYFWLFLISAMMCGEVVIIVSAISQAKKNYWIFGLGLILILDAILLFMPMIRGYSSYGSGDVLTHIGYMKDILQTSSFGINHYPIDHILGVIIHLISGISLRDITLIIPPFFSFFFILSIYFMGKIIFQNKFEQFFLVTLTSVLMLGEAHFAFTPNTQAFFLVPLVLYLAFKMYYDHNSKKYNILLLLIGFLIVFYHPLVTLMVILILFSMQIMQYILKKYHNNTLKKVNYFYTIVFMSIIFSMWSVYLQTATLVAKPIIERILGEGTTSSELQQNVVTITNANIDPFFLLKLIINIYGQFIILGILSLLCIGLILKSLKNQKTQSNFYKGFLVMAFIVFLMLSFFMLFTNSSFSFERIILFIILFSLLIIPIGFYLFLYNNPNDKSLSSKTIIMLFGIIVIMFCITYFSTFNLYNSPIIMDINQQVPLSDYIGMSTFFSYRDESFPILEIGPVSYRFGHALYGYHSSRFIFTFENKMPPAHFGYQNETLSRNFFNNTKYLLLNDQGRGYNPHVNPDFEDKWSIVPKEFEQLKSDNRIQQVYSNKYLEIFVLSNRSRR